MPAHTGLAGSMPVVHPSPCAPSEPEEARRLPVLGLIFGVSTVGMYWECPECGGAPLIRCGHCGAEGCEKCQHRGEWSCTACVPQ